MIDTNPKIEKVLIEMIQKKSISQRLSMLQSLSSLTIRLSKRAIARVNPNCTKQELDLLFVKYNYGDDLYHRVSKFFSKSNNEKK
jgi:hypothetical protein